ncbi:MAG: PEGA domain-containing protein [Bacteroidales bacterium]|nr:PEGA domain-containing protein [Candidatus Latescibacterota bacterium]
MNDRQDKHFEPIANPYIVGNPIEDRRMFFGRVDDFEFIERKVTGNMKGGMIVLCGSRRSGKTSILFQIRQGRLGPGFVPVLIDMQSVTVTNDREFLETIARAIDSAPGLKDSLVDEDFLSRLETNPLLAFNEFTAKVDTALDGRNLILMFDEYELFESHIDREKFSSDVLNLMAYWMENSSGVYFLFTGSNRLEERNPEYWDSFLGKALHRRVSFLRHGDTMRLIHDPVADLVDYQEGVPEEMFSLTAGQPFYTQVLCQSIVDHLNESCKNTVSMSDVEDVVGEIIENPLPQMIFSWSSLSALDKIVLSLIGELSKEKARSVDPDDIIEFAEKEKIGYRIDPNKLRETAERLFSQDFLSKDQESESYSFRMDLWRRWVIRMHSIWQVLDEIATDGFDPDEGIEPIKKGKKIATIASLTGAVLITVMALVYSYNIREKGRQGAFTAPADSTTLEIATEPPGAQVFIDRTLVGESPVMEKVEVGTSFLRIAMTGYHEFEDSISLEKDVPFEKRVGLIEKTGRLLVGSQPEGAVVELDGHKTGLTTPASFDSLTVNSLHSVVLHLPGYYARETAGIQIVSDSTITITHNFSRVVHPLTVITDPAGALVTIDGEDRGESPVSIRAIEQGSHLIMAVMDGYFDSQMKVDIPVIRNQVLIVLDRLPPGELILEIIPYAELWIDGRLVERDAVNYRASLLQGSYLIELRHPVFGDITETVILRSGETTKKTFNLERRD